MILNFDLINIDNDSARVFSTNLDFLDFSSVPLGLVLRRTKFFCLKFRALFKFLWEINKIAVRWQLIFILINIDRKVKKNDVYNYFFYSFTRFVPIESDNQVTIETSKITKLNLIPNKQILHYFC